MSSLKDIKKEVERLREDIRQADYCYYVLNEPQIADKEYDNLVNRLKEREEQYPTLISPDSPTQRVSGGILEGFPTTKHKTRMLSLDNTYSIEELRAWEEKLKRLIKRDIELDYTVEPKIDGVSCSLTYQQGTLIQGATRGDGERGEVVTPNIKTIKSVPLKLRGKYPPGLEVRGEVYMEKDDFEKMNKKRLKQGEPVFANPRNATGGSLKLLDPTIVAGRKLNCFIHSFGWSEGHTFKSHRDFLDKVRTWGLRTDSKSKYCKNLTEVIDYCLKMQNERDAFSYEVDGMVVKVNHLSLQKELGATLKSPRWAVAYKFPAHQATTKVVEVSSGVGRTGIITPTALFEPVECGGVTISRATLHNFDEIKRLDVRVGDTVLIERAGEVIPKVIKVITPKRTGKEKKITPPTKCPACGAKASKEKEGEVYVYCTNINCSAQIKRSLLHFASRKAMDIEGLGESVVDELVRRKMVEDLTDIYRLKKEDLLNLPLFADRKGENLIAAITKSKKRGLARFLYALGIRHVGEKAARVLAGRFKDIDKFFSLESDNYESIPEVGPVMAASLVRFFSQKTNKTMIEQFKNLGIVLKEAAAVTSRGPFMGKTFVFTGELKALSRAQAQRLIEQLGGKWSSSVSRKTDYVVAGENPGSKYTKAKSLGVRILDESEFIKLIGT